MGQGRGFFLLSLLVVLVIIGDLTGVSASKKGRSYWAFFFLSLVLPVITWLVIAAMSPIEPKIKETESKNVDSRQCPFCAEDIKLAAIVCKHCGKDV